MKNYWLLSLLLLLVVSACKKDDVDEPAKPEFNVNFRATYDGQPIEKFKTYDYGGFKVRWTRFNLYLSDVILLKGSEEVKVADILFLNFTPDDATSNQTPTLVLTTDQVPAGDYTGIRLGFGVRPDLNAKKPSDYSPEHPLYLESEFWPGWQSYIFSKVEGGADPGNDGAFELDLVYHTGGNQCYKSFDFQHVFSVDDKGGTANIDLDLKKLFTFDGQLFDVVATPSSSHGSSGVALMEQLQDNYDNAVDFR